MRTISYTTRKANKEAIAAGTKLPPKRRRSKSERQRTKQSYERRRNMERKVASILRAGGLDPKTEYILPKAVEKAIRNNPLGKFKDMIKQAADMPAGTIEHLLQLAGCDKGLLIEIMTRACYEQDPVALKFIVGWEQLSVPEQRATNLDAFCRLIKIRPSAVVGLFVEYICRIKQQAAILRAALALDSIVDASIEFSKDKDGLEDRKLILKNQRFIEERHGPAVVIDQRQQTAILGERTFEAIIKEQPQLEAAVGGIEGIESVEGIEGAIEGELVETNN